MKHDSEGIIKASINSRCFFNSFLFDEENRLWGFLPAFLNQEINHRIIQLAVGMDFLWGVQLPGKG